MSAQTNLLSFRVVGFESALGNVTEDYTTTAADFDGVIAQIKKGLKPHYRRNLQEITSDENSVCVGVYIGRGENSYLESWTIEQLPQDPEITEQEKIDLALSRGQDYDNVKHMTWFKELCNAYQKGDVEL